MTVHEKQRTSSPPRRRACPPLSSEQRLPPKSRPSEKRYTVNASCMTTRWQSVRGKLERPGLTSPHLGRILSIQQAKSKPVSLLFTSASKVTPLYKALSTDFYRQMDFFAARDSKVGQETMRAFGVDKVPALVVLHGDEVAKYDGVSSLSREEPTCFGAMCTDADAREADRSAQVRQDPCFPGTVCGSRPFSIRRQSRSRGIVDATTNPHTRARKSLCHKRLHTSKQK